MSENSESHSMGWSVSVGSNDGTSLGASRSITVKGAPADKPSEVQFEEWKRRSPT